MWFWSGQVLLGGERVLRLFACLFVALFTYIFTLVSNGQYAYAQVLSADLEVKLVPDVDGTWTVVNLENTYTNAVVICTYNLPSNTDQPATTRVRSITATSFQVRIQKFENSAAVTASGVHCIIADEGAYNSGGLKFEARTVISNNTSGLSVPGGWGFANNEEVTGSVTQAYASPVVLGQVMSFNDVKASVFWSFNCANRKVAAFDTNGRICVGKHIGQINGSRANETLGYIVAETGSGTINGMKYALARGANSIRGIGGAPPYNYSLTDNYDIGVASQDGENGGQGGWAVLYGADPLPANLIKLGIDEETVAGDTSRGHIAEEVAYWVFKDNQVTNLSASKTVAMSTESASTYAIPGSDVIYTISAANTGTKAVDVDTMFIVDSIPADATFYNGDIDGAGPETGVAIFTSTGSGLTFNEATDLGFSNAGSAPANFAACSYTPSAGYDPAVTYVCFNPKGKFNAGSLATSEFSVKFRVQVK